MSTAEITTILGEGSVFEGKLTFEGAVRIDGSFTGEIQTAGTLIVGETAEVRANIEGREVIVRGRVRGDIRAKDLVELTPPANVRGDIATPALEIGKGALFDGKCVMDGELASSGDPEPSKPAEDSPQDG